MTGTNLLRTLAGPILPAGVSKLSGSTGSSGQIEGQSFAELLAGEKSGKLSSGRGVNIHPDSGVKLNADQLQRLGVALDRAEASGAQHALVMIDGMALKVDVGVRQVVSQVNMADAEVASGIDAVIQAGDATKSKTNGLTMPGTGFHPSLAKMLEGPTENAA